MSSYKLLAAPKLTGRTGGLSDLAPLLIMCEESVADLNARRAQRGLPTVGIDRFRPISRVSPLHLPYISNQVGIDRFRPNLVLRGCSPLEEDRWCGLTT